MTMYRTLILPVVLICSLAGSAPAADATARGRALLARHGLAQFDVDGNGVLDAGERAAALAAKNANRNAVDEPQVSDETRPHNRVAVMIRSKTSSASTVNRSSASVASGKRSTKAVGGLPAGPILANMTTTPATTPSYIPPSMVGNMGGGGGVIAAIAAQGNAANFAGAGAGGNVAGPMLSAVGLPNVAGAVAVPGGGISFPSPYGVVNPPIGAQPVLLPGGGSRVDPIAAVGGMDVFRGVPNQLLPGGGSYVASGHIIGSAGAGVLFASGGGFY
jgi:hypothetical protein